MEREMFLRSMGGPMNAVREILHELSEEEALEILNQMFLEVSFSMITNCKIQSAKESIRAMHEITRTIAPCLSYCLTSLKTPGEALEAWVLYSSELIASFCAAIITVIESSADGKRKIVKAIPEMYHMLLEELFTQYSSTKTVS